jgi:mannan endo-1,4-beta-mannosidase
MNVELSSSTENTGAADGAADGSTATEPSVYWGAVVQGWPGDPAAVDGFEGIAGKRMSILAWGSAWWHDDSYIPFQTAYFQFARDHGSIPLLSWGSWDYCCGSEQTGFQLSSITRGDHDAFLIAWARAARLWGHPFFLNLDSEMNGWWWPWSEQTNGNGAGDFQLAWRHVVDIFRQEGATNVTWVWCPNIVESLSTPLTELYPGDDYVDWACMDGYNWGTAQGNIWQDFQQVFSGSTYKVGNTYRMLRQIAPSKPIMIAEMASTDAGGSKADWITDAYTRSLPVDFPDVRAVVWYGWPDGAPDVDWAIDTSPEAQAAFAAGVALPRYATNAYRTITTVPIPPPDGPFQGD